MPETLGHVLAYPNADAVQTGEPMLRIPVTSADIADGIIADLISVLKPTFPELVIHAPAPSGKPLRHVATIRVYLDSPKMGGAPVIIRNVMENDSVNALCDAFLTTLRPAHPFMALHVRSEPAAAEILLERARAI